MATWKVARSSKVCALTGRPLEPGASVVTALFGADEEISEDKVRGAGFVRKDFLVDDAPPEALDAAIADAYCVWRTKLQAAAVSLGRLGRPKSIEITGTDDRGGMEHTIILFKFDLTNAEAEMYRTPDGVVQQFLVSRK